MEKFDNVIGMILIYIKYKESVMLSAMQIFFSN